MKPGAIHQIRIYPKDYLLIIEMLKEAGISIDESTNVLAGLTFSSLLEVYRKVNLKNDFLKEVHQLRALWNVSGSEPKQEQKQVQREQVPLEQQDTLDLLAELERLEGLKHMPGAEQIQARIKTILMNRNNGK